MMLAFLYYALLFEMYPHRAAPFPSIFLFTVAEQGFLFT